MQLHGQTIAFSDIKDKFPGRNDFLNKVELNADIKTLNSCKPINVLPNDIDDEVYYLHDKDYEYHMIMSCIMPSGLKIAVSVRTSPYFLLRIPDDYLGFDVFSKDDPPNIQGKINSFIEKIRETLKERKVKHRPELKCVRKFNHTGFQLNKGFYVKIPFYTNGQRKQAIRMLSAGVANNTVQIFGYKCQSAHDDLTCYYRVLCRDIRIDLCGWNRISSYEIKQCPYGEMNIDYFIECMDTDITKLTNLSDQMRYDKSFMLSWDIECYRNADDGNLPDPLVDDDKVFMVGMTYSCYSDKKPILRVCITSEPCDASNDDLTVQCSTETELLKAFAQIIGKLKPEFIVGFNDGDFDWKFMAEKANTALLLEYFRKYMSDIYRASTMTNEEDMALFKKLGRSPKNTERLKFVCQKLLGTNHRPERGARGIDLAWFNTKLEAQLSCDTYSLKYFGYVPIDVRCRFRALMKNPEESSLNFFLKINNLAQKDDMPIVELFNIFRKMKDARARNDESAIAEYAADMARIKRYCVYDAEACHMLMNKRNIIMDSRSVSSIAYTSFADAIYRADGMKVRNYVISDAALRDIAYTNLPGRKMGDEKYVGAYVVPPKKGVYVSKLSIRERIQAAHANIKYSYGGLEDYAHWNINDEDASILEEFLERVIPLMNYTIPLNAAVMLVDNELKTLPAHLYGLAKEFLLEENGRPISGLDFSSLYPSIMMAYNLSKETIIRPEYGNEQGIAKFEHSAERLRKMGYTLHRIEFKHGIAGAESSVLGYSIRHRYDPTAPNADPARDGFGIFPTILHYLFNERKKIKKIMSEAGKTIEKTEKQVSELRKSIAESTDPDEIGRLENEISQLVDTEKYREVLFNHTYYGSKQLALKIFMNTFYGESGNQLSSIYMLELAGGITTEGQKNIKNVFKLVESMNCKIIYGDTDSAYVMCPESIYQHIDAKYYSGEISKEQCWTEIVEATFVEIEKVNKMVNEAIYQDNGTRFLTTAYEEVLFPSAFLAKKKYFGIPHEQIVNFNVKNLMIKGLELKKRGVPEILKTTCSKIMEDSMRMDQIRSLRQLTIDAINFVYTNKWDAVDFVKTAMYKPNKKNITINSFVERVKEEYGIIIKPVERFSFVYVKKYPFKFDVYGGTQRLKKSDYMELIDIVNERNMEISLDEYVTGGLIGQFARLIAYDKIFEENVSDDDSARVREEKIIKNAKDYITQICVKYMDTYENPHRIHKRIYKTVSTSFNNKIGNIRGVDSLALASTIGENILNDMYKIVVDEELDTIRQYAVDLVARLRANGHTLTDIRKEYVGTRTIRGNCDISLEAIEADIRTLDRDLGRLIKRNEIIVNARAEAIENIIYAFREAVQQEYDDLSLISTLDEYFKSKGKDFCEQQIDVVVANLKSKENDIMIIDNKMNLLKIKIREKIKMLEIKKYIMDKISSDSGLFPPSMDIDRIIAEDSNIDLGDVPIL